MTRELTCDEAQALYFDRTSEVELDAETNQALDQHLASCELCQVFVKEVADMDEELAGVLDAPDLNDPEETEADVARVMAAIKAYESGRDVSEKRAGGSAPHDRGSPWGPLLLVAVVLVVVGLSIRQEPTPKPFPGIPTAGPSVQEVQLELDEERALRKQRERELDEERDLRKQRERELEQARSQREADARELEARIEELERLLDEARNE